MHRNIAKTIQHKWFQVSSCSFNPSLFDLVSLFSFASLFFTFEVSHFRLILIPFLAVSILPLKKNRSLEAQLLKRRSALTLNDAYSDAFWGVEAAQRGDASRRAKSTPEPNTKRPGQGTLRWRCPPERRNALEMQRLDGERSRDVNQMIIFKIKFQETTIYLSRNHQNHSKSIYSDLKCCL